MSIRVNSKMPAVAQNLRESRKNQEQLQKSNEKLASGTRVNRAADNAADLAVAKKMLIEIESTQQGSENLYQGLDMLTVAEGSMDLIENNLSRMGELAQSAMNESLNEEQREAISLEYDQQKAEIDRVTETAQFNDIQLLDGTTGDIGINVGSGDSITVAMSKSTDTAALGLESTTLSGADGSNARSAQTSIEAAQTQVSTMRADFGSTMNRIESAAQGATYKVENLAASASRIMDIDYAKETARNLALQVKQQQNQASLAHGNLNSEMALTLLEK